MLSVNTQNMYIKFQLSTTLYLNRKAEKQLIK